MQLSYRAVVLKNNLTLLIQRNPGIVNGQFFELRLRKPIFLTLFLTLYRSNWFPFSRERTVLTENCDSYSCYLHIQIFFFSFSCFWNRFCFRFSRKKERKKEKTYSCRLMIWKLYHREKKLVLHCRSTNQRHKWSCILFCLSVSAADRKINKINSKVYLLLIFVFYRPL